MRALWTVEQAVGGTWRLRRTEKTDAGAEHQGGAEGDRPIEAGAGDEKAFRKRNKQGEQVLCRETSGWKHAQHPYSEEKNGGVEEHQTKTIQDHREGARADQRFPEDGSD